MRKAFKDLKEISNHLKQQYEFGQSKPTSRPPPVNFATRPGLGSSHGSIREQQAVIAAGPLLQPPQERDVLAYRYHHGTNVGSIFVLEKWLFGNLFTDLATGDSELDAVKSQASKYGVDAARQNFESFWSTTMTPEDWNYLANTGNVTTIRLPIGYFTLGPRFCQGTPFERYSKVYENAWLYVKQYISTAASYGIATLIDLHALPGGANKDAHSGTTSHKAELWGNSRNLSLSVECLKFIAMETRDMPFVSGIQLANEAVYQASGMYNFYDNVINAIYLINPHVPLYISDGWEVRPALQYSKNVNERWLNPIVVDTHKYYTFDEEHKRLNPYQIIEAVNLNEVVEVKDQGAGCIIGEYSCVMDGRSWGNIQGEERKRLATQFGQRQTETWRRSSGGCFFWTYKMAWMPGGEWGFREQTNNSALPVHPLSSATAAPFTIEQLLSKATQARENLRAAAMSQHINYWNNSAPGQYFEHHRFQQGWDVGYNDAVTFFGYRLHHFSTGVKRNGADRIGLLDVWVKKRDKEYEAQESRSSGPSGVNKQFFWEFTHGLKVGIRDFEQLVGF